MDIWQAFKKAKNDGVKVTDMDDPTFYVYYKDDCFRSCDKIFGDQELILPLSTQHSFFDVRQWGVYPD